MARPWKAPGTSVRSIENMIDQTVGTSVGGWDVGVARSNLRAIGNRIIYVMDPTDRKEDPCIIAETFPSCGVVWIAKWSRFPGSARSYNGHLRRYVKVADLIENTIKDGRDGLWRGWEIVRSRERIDSERNAAMIKSAIGKWERTHREITGLGYHELSDFSDDDFIARGFPRHNAEGVRDRHGYSESHWSEADRAITYLIRRIGPVPGLWVVERPVEIGELPDRENKGEGVDRGDVLDASNGIARAERGKPTTYITDSGLSVIAKAIAFAGPQRRPVSSVIRMMVASDRPLVPLAQRRMGKGE